MDNESRKVNYLQLLQEPISRMSSTSAIFKGFSSAILAGLATATMADIDLWALILGLIPITSFAALDLFYLSLERKLKYRYRQVIDGAVALDYKINTKLDKIEKREAKSSIWWCLLSPSIWIFYITVFACGSVLIIFKAIGII